MNGIFIIKQIREYRRIRHENNNRNEIIFYCDNEAVIKTINTYRQQKLTPRMIYMANMDVFMEIFHMLEDTTLNIRFQHIKGHQDQGPLPLTYPAYLNQQADKWATKGLSTRQIPQKEIDLYRAVVKINGLPLYSGHKKIIKNTYHAEKYMKYIGESNKWEDQTVGTIWLPVSAKSLNLLTESQRTTMTKMIQKRIPCNKREKLYYPYLSDTCKLCADTIECTHHILRCPNCNEREELRLQFIKNMKYAMRQQKTSVTTIMIFTHYIVAWLENLRPKDINILVPEATVDQRRAVEDQTKLGWDQVFYGRLSKEWGKVYQRDIEKIEHGLPNPNPEKWGITLISIAQRYALDAWYIRNKKEYDETEEKSTTTSKCKLIRKILWYSKKVEQDINHPYKNIDEQIMKDLPMANLEIMAQQIGTIYKYQKKKNEGK
jgi:hypothetical protein